MFARLVVLFVGVPLIELYILHHLANGIGFWETVGLVFATGVLGASLARWQGLSTLARIQTDLSEGHLPGQALLDGAMILVAGALLLTPGILTDLFGFSLLFPPCRYVYRKWLKARWNVQFQMHLNQQTYSHDSSVVDGEATPVSDPEIKHDPHS